MKTRTLLAVVAALSASGVFARTGFVASPLQRYRLLRKGRGVLARAEVQHIQ